MKIYNAVTFTQALANSSSISPTDREGYRSLEIQLEANSIEYSPHPPHRASQSLESHLSAFAAVTLTQASMNSSSISPDRDPGSSKFNWMQSQFNIHRTGTHNELHA